MTDDPKPHMNKEHRTEKKKKLHVQFVDAHALYATTRKTYSEAKDNFISIIKQSLENEKLFTSRETNHFKMILTLIDGGDAE